MASISSAFSLKVLFLGLLTIGSNSFAAAPTQVGDSFVTLAYSFRGTGSSFVLYLGKDGSCKRLSDVAGDYIAGELTYVPSVAGTYTYAVTPGVPDEATLATSTCGTFALKFKDGFSGFINVAGVGDFSFLPASPNTFLTNVSNRSQLRANDTSISGFVIEGSSSRLVLIRTVGPTLSKFGISPVSASPGFNLYLGSSTTPTAVGQSWGSIKMYDAQAMGWIFEIAGAFSLGPESNDVVFFGLLAPGNYTVQAFDTKAGNGGVTALTEIYVLPYSGSSGQILRF